MKYASFILLVSIVYCYAFGMQKPHAERFMYMQKLEEVDCRVVQTETGVRNYAEGQSIIQEEQVMPLQQQEEKGCMNKKTRCGLLWFANGILWWNVGFFIGAMSFVFYNTYNSHHVG